MGDFTHVVKRAYYNLYNLNSLWVPGEFVDTFYPVSTLAIAHKPSTRERFLIGQGEMRRPEQREAARAAAEEAWVDERVAEGESRRVLEVTPPGDAAHWAELVASPRLVAALDAILGEGGWELPVNAAAPTDGGRVPVRHWYAPVAFPDERGGCDDPAGSWAPVNRRGRGKALAAGGALLLRQLRGELDRLLRRGQRARRKGSRPTPPTSALHHGVVAPIGATRTARCWCGSNAHRQRELEPRPSCSHLVSGWAEW